MQAKTKNVNYVVFDEYRTNSAGAWYFVPDEGKFCRGKPCYGFGAVKYVEGSVYDGDLYYDGEAFNKIGYGQQDFCRSRISDKDIRSGLRKSKYVGSFDYRKTDWIYGNGVMYYVDDLGKPLYFLKGFFSGTSKIGEWQGKFDYATLLDGYSADMEIDCEENDKLGDWLQKKVASCKDKPADVLFVGDSYFDFGDSVEYAGKNLFGNVFPDTYVNIGIGGTKFCEWQDWIDNIADIVAPRKIAINLGFNDVHGGVRLKTIYGNYISLLDKLRKYFPTSEVYLVQIIHSPQYKAMYQKECDFNAMTSKSAAKLGVKLIDWNESIVASGRNCFYADKVHPDEYGYELFEKALIKAFDD